MENNNCFDDVDKLEPCILLVRMQNAVAAMKNSMVFPQKIIHCIIT